MDYISAVAQLNNQEPRTYYIRTFGCQQNEHDSEKLAGLLEKMLFAPSDNPEDSSLVLFNTCCVRENAELKIFGHLGKLKNLKEKRPDTVIVVCGCMMQQEHIVDKIKDKYPHVDIIFGTKLLHRFPEMLYTVLNERRMVIETGMDESFDPDCAEPVRKSGLKAWVNIATGCNNFCSYCIVPYVRGREQSRDSSKILDEVKNLASNGYKEITLLGQNVNSYYDKNSHTDFAQLLYMVNEIAGIERIRFVTSHPADFSLAIARAMKECEKVCEHLHLPLQAGSNRVLKKMNRRYTREEYLDKIRMIRSEVPGIAFTTDIIVAFPGETEQDFEDTLDILEKVRYDSAFTFIYSKRKGTPAEKFSDQIDRQTAQERFERLLDVQNRISSEISRSYTGKTVQVLVEGLSKTNRERLTGRTRTNKVVNFTGNKAAIGSLVDVKITRAGTWHLEGSLA